MDEERCRAALSELLYLAELIRAALFGRALYLDEERCSAALLAELLYRAERCLEQLYSVIWQSSSINALQIDLL